MVCIAPGWINAHSPYHLAKGWVKGGISPFSRLPEHLLRRADMISERAERRIIEKRASAPPLQLAAIRMSSADALHWGAMASLMPLSGKRQVAAEELADGDDDDSHTVRGSRLGASEIFNCPPKKRLHLSGFVSAVREIKANTKPELLLKADEVTHFRGSSAIYLTAC